MSAHTIDQPTAAEIMRAGADQESLAIATFSYGNRMRRNNVAAVITRLARSVGITRNVTPHGMRRTFASTAVRLGASHTDLQHAMNHADPRTTSLYLMGEKGGSISRQLVAELLAS